MKRIGLFSAALALLLGIFAAVYLADYYEAEPAAAVAGTDAVRVYEAGDNLFFIPHNPKAALIFYPGGKVEHLAYAPLMMDIADGGIACVLVKMPFHLAVFDIDAAEAARAMLSEYPDIGSFYLGGHSLGGSMAAQNLQKHPDEYDGLLLLASYSASDISNIEASVLSIYGSEDGVLDGEKYRDKLSNLPDQTLEKVIIGGNHAGFGSYGAQEGDGEAKITNAEQMKLCADYFCEWVRTIEESKESN